MANLPDSGVAARGFSLSPSLASSSEIIRAAFCSDDSRRSLPKWLRAAKEVATIVVTTVKATGIGLQEPLHSVRQIGLWGFGY